MVALPNGKEPTPQGKAYKVGQTIGKMIGLMLAASLAAFAARFGWELAARMIHG